ncbi:trigger factor [Capsulimonas corticalis]|uniref:Trigger factor n=1 Tax=Capsulimonas corticalis TaxID=2219043 RepID=A0A402CXN3_9BACT|nr:trigger factor [Capsulimonas corticalis]BDI32216.1 trigger factor [Capsulimonas corticalis]
MQVTKEPIDPCQVALTIEVEQDKVVHAVDKAYREYAKYVNVPGFRKGKAPMSFVRQRVPESDVRQRTAELLVESAYGDALKESETDPYAPPKLELLQLDLAGSPFIFKALVPLAPKVELGDYKGLEVEKKIYDISDSDVDEEIERLRERAADYPMAERAVENRDLVVADVSVKLDDQEATEPRPTMIELGADNLPGFDEQILGASVGDTKTFTLAYPADYPQVELQGKDAEFSVTIKEVRTKVVPESNDELAGKITNGRITTLDELKSNIKTDMGRSLSQSSENEADNALVEKIIEKASIQYPPVLVESEIEDEYKFLQQRLAQNGTNVDDYLANIGTSREQLYNQFKDSAEKRIRVGLVLGEIARQEELTLTEPDIDAAIAEAAEQQNTSPAAMRAFLEKNEGFENIRNRAQAKKVLDFIRGSAIIKEKVVKPGQTENPTDEAAAPEAAAATAEGEEVPAPKKKAPRASSKKKESDDQNES